MGRLSLEEVSRAHAAEGPAGAAPDEEEARLLEEALRGMPRREPAAGRQPHRDVRPAFRCVMRAITRIRAPQRALAVRRCRRQRLVVPAPDATAAAPPALAVRMNSLRATRLSGGRCGSKCYPGKHLCYPR